MSKRVFGFFNDFVPYYRQLRPITKSTLSSILAAKLEIWFEKYPDGFYKFLEPAPGHKDYRDGDSWTEEIGLSSREFKSAFENIGVAYPSKSEFEKAENKFSKETTIPSYEIEKKFDEEKNKQVVKRMRERENENTVETVMFYCSYVDKKTNLTWYYKNYDHDILEEALSSINTQNAKGDLQRITNPILTDPEREKRSVENAKSDLKESPFVDSSFIIVDNTKENAKEPFFCSNINPQEASIPQASSNIQEDQKTAENILDLPTAEDIVNTYYSTNGNNTLAKKIHRKLKTLVLENKITEEELIDQLKQSGGLWRWLGENEPKAKRQAWADRSSNGKTNAPKEETGLERWVREFVTKKLIPLDTQLNGGEQKMFFNRKEHSNIFRPAYEESWPEDEILRRYENYLSHGGYYRKAGHPLALFVAQFNNFAKKKRKRPKLEVIPFVCTPEMRAEQNEAIEQARKEKEEFENRELTEEEKAIKEYLMTGHMPGAIEDDEEMMIEENESAEGEGQPQKLVSIFDQQ